MAVRTLLMGLACLAEPSVGCLCWVAFCGRAVCSRHGGHTLVFQTRTAISNRFCKHLITRQLGQSSKRILFLCSFVCLFVCLIDLIRTWSGMRTSELGKTCLWTGGRGPGLSAGIRGGLCVGRFLGLLAVCFGRSQHWESVPRLC